ncbi:hypothetical protein KEM54_006325 [Ascosphaera aggregata]|nr:hypothetical protein KEM54_006325 [Ascosphaera aggregata]
MAQQQDAMVQRTPDKHSSDAPSVSQNPSQQQVAQSLPSPKELLWCYQLRNEHAALMRRTDDLGTQLGHLQESQQNGERAYSTLSQCYSGLSDSFKAAESVLNNYAARLDDVERSVAEKPDTAAMLQQLLCTMRSEMEGLGLQLAKPCRGAEVAFCQRLDATEGVLQLLVQTTESMRDLISGLTDELRRVQTTALAVQDRLNTMQWKGSTRLAPPGSVWQNAGQNSIAKKTEGLDLPAMGTCQVCQDDLAEKGGLFIAKKTTIMDSQPAETHQELVPRWDNHVANNNPKEIGKSQGFHGPVMSQWSPEVEEHHQYGGSLEIDQMPSPLGSAHCLPYISTPASIERACTTVTATSITCTGPDPTKPQETSIRQGNRTLREYLKECRTLLHGRFPRRRNEANAVELFWEGLNEDDDTMVAKSKIEEALEQKGWLWEVCCDVVEELEHGKQRSTTSATEEQEAQNTQKQVSKGRNMKKRNYSSESYRPSSRSRTDWAPTTDTDSIPLAVVAEERAGSGQVKKKGRTAVSCARASQRGQPHDSRLQPAPRITRKASLRSNAGDRAGTKSEYYTEKTTGRQQSFRGNRKRRRREIPIVWDEEVADLS